jgi:hypothetical protein
MNINNSQKDSVDNSVDMLWITLWINHIIPIRGTPNGVLLGYTKWCTLGTPNGVLSLHQMVYSRFLVPIAAVWLRGCRKKILNKYIKKYIKERGKGSCVYCIKTGVIFLFLFFKKN